MNKKIAVSIVLLLWTGLGVAGDFNGLDKTADFHGTQKAKTIARFGVITDIHHTNKRDTQYYKYSAALEKTAYFVKTMNRKKVDFIIELGDMIDNIESDDELDDMIDKVVYKDPIQNLNEIESIFTSFNGPQYHVLGNHEFDSIERRVLLSNLENTGIPSGETYYSFDMNGIHYIVLDATYTNDEPHLPFGLPDNNTRWNYKDAWVPQAELEWLEGDLAASNLPTVVFTHQVLHLKNTASSSIKNADVVRRIFEADGQVMAVFSGHVHGGAFAILNSILYFVLKGNVGIDRIWSKVSPTTYGLDAKKDCPFALVEIKEVINGEFRDLKRYQIAIVGNAQQESKSYVSDPIKLQERDIRPPDLSPILYILLQD